MDGEPPAPGRSNEAHRLEGFEVGFYFGKQRVFVGNFIHKTEATKWWSMMTKEIKTFTKRYAVGQDYSFGWYTKFFSAHLYKHYYGFLDQQFAKYQKTFAKSFAADERRYRTFSKKWDRTERTVRMVA